LSWTVGSGNRNPSTIHMKAGILSKINYPTGGSTIFDFEPHKFLTSGGIVEGGGLRIKSIKNYDSKQVITNQQTYSYGENEDGLGIRLFDERLFSRNYEDIVEALLHPLVGVQKPVHIGTGSFLGSASTIP